MKTINLSKTDIYKGSLVLVNSAVPVQDKSPKKLAPALARYPKVLLLSEAASALSAAVKSVGGEDKIVPVSGYRSTREQAEIYDSSLKENGLAFTQSYVARVNHSEHQTALAIDLALNADDIDFIRPNFPYEGICDKFRKIIAGYGFIERYSADKEHITGIAHEPWHFRYVGCPHSAVITQGALSLEEYIAYIKQFPYGKKHLKVKSNTLQYEIFYIAAKKASTAVCLPEGQSYKISGNNADGFIATIWRHCGE